MKGRRILAVLAALLLPVAVFAGATQEGAATTSTVANVDPTGAEVLYWHQHSGARQEGLDGMIADFNSSNEWGITVTGEFAGGYDDVYNKMITAIAGGLLPNLVVAYQNQAAGYQVADALVDMDIYVSDSKWGLTAEEKADFFEGFYNQDISAQFGGTRLGFPPQRSLEVMYYNKDWLKSLGFDNPAASWSDFYAQVKAARDPAKDKWGYSVRTDASNVFAQIISRGADIQNPDGSGYQFDIPQLKDAMRMFQRMYQEGIVKKIAENYGDQTDFGNYIVMFTMGSTSGMPYYQRAVDAGQNGPFEWSVTAIPHSTPKPVLDVYGASLSIPKTTEKQQLAAWLFIKWMSEPQQQADWVKISNYFPVRKSVAPLLTDYLAENPKYKDALTLLNSSGTAAEPPWAGYDEVRDTMEAMFNAVLDGADVDQAVKDLEEEANKIHREASP
ncbi:MAG: extracellular solute-binding protein [Thermoleophilia bacterium]|nr:extracellular solute-binding protein [Thermoleophilia bacterium]